MIVKTGIAAREFTPGRYFLGRLLPGEDLIASVEETCRHHAIETAVFDVSGTVTSMTIGAFDPQQKVYVTFADESPYEIAGCTGTVCLNKGVPSVQARIVLSDWQGNTTGGRLFSKTIIYSVEICLQELAGSPLERAYDPDTGQDIWHFNPSK